MTSSGQCFDSDTTSTTCIGNCGIRFNLRKSTLKQRHNIFTREIEKFSLKRNKKFKESKMNCNKLYVSDSSCSCIQAQEIHNHHLHKCKNRSNLIFYDQNNNKSIIFDNNNKNIHNDNFKKKINPNSCRIFNNFKDKNNEIKNSNLNEFNLMSKLSPNTSALIAAATTTPASTESLSPSSNINKQVVVVVHCCQRNDLNNSCLLNKSTTIEEEEEEYNQIKNSSSLSASSLCSTEELDFCNSNNNNNCNKVKKLHLTKRIKCVKHSCKIDGEKSELVVIGNDNIVDNNIDKNLKNFDDAGGGGEGGGGGKESILLKKCPISDNNSSKSIKTNCTTTDNNLNQTFDSKQTITNINNNNNNNNNNDIEINEEMEEDQQSTRKEFEKEGELPPSPSYSPRNRSIQRHKLVSLCERNNSSSSIFNKQHMPWFGIDVGGTLVKVVFFDPKDANNEELITLKRIRRYLKSSKPYGTTGKRDSHLEMSNCIINNRVGTLHFIRFATNRMSDFLTMAKNKRFADTIHNVCATGGGAYKFEDDIKKNLGITLHKTDELDSIIYGIHYIDKYNSDRECYFLEDPLDENKCIKVPYDFSRPYPYLVVNIGSGVSILAVYSSTSYSRISGSSIGGGTFLGLCCLLTQCETFDEAIKLAKAGSSSKIDKLVKDIYGGDYPKFNLSGDTVASSFGHMNIAEKRKDVKREDLARGLLEMVTINIGLIARMCAEKEDIDRVVFIGNFLRVNQLSMKLLSYAVNYWSKGAMKALFLEHEGYFGAVGCFVESSQGCHHI